MKSILYKATGKSIEIFVILFKNYFINYYSAVKRSKNIQKHYKSFSALNGFEESIIERTTKERNLVEQVASNSNNNSSNTALPRLANALKSLLSSNGGFFKSKVNLITRIIYNLTIF